MIGGYDCTSCKNGGAKKAPVKPRRGGNSGNELFNAFNSAVANIKMAGGARKKGVKKGVKKVKMCQSFFNPKKSFSKENYLNNSVAS